MDGFLTELTAIEEETKKHTDRTVEAAYTTVATCPCRFSQIEQAEMWVEVDPYRSIDVDVYN